MKKLKLLFNVSEAALTAAVFVLVTALVPMDIILKLVSQSVINGNPCLYDALISVNVSTMWRYVVPFVLFYVLYIQKYDLNSAIVIRRKIQQGIHGNRRYSTEPPITVAFYNCICYRSICNTVCIRHAYDDYVVAY